ncbi:MAG TPA: MmgE/PrpD family protein [Bryobacteraceae bacterium]|jgi:2-methylcitrate dehydratase PrpD
MSETSLLASYIVNAQIAEIPQDVRHEARRAILNYAGCAIGGSREPAVDAAIRAFAPFSGNPTAGILGRSERMDPLHASLMNGISSHVHDYDDTTPQNYIHPSSPVASALFAYASANPVRGTDFLNAFVAGFEAESRIGNAVYPAHYDAGWHITGTAGTFGAAAAIGKLMGLSERQTIWALGLAATQAAGLREMFGSMAKALHPGKAAQNGYASALLAQADFTAGEHALEGPRGFAAVTAAVYDLSKIAAGLGQDFNLRRNTYKPFPCGIVIHPTIDGCIQIREAHKLDPASIAAVRLRVAPLVLDLCNKRSISLGLEGKFSVYHGAALGLVRGKAGLREFTDEAVNDPAIRRIREITTAAADPDITEDQARIEVELANGETIERFVAQSLGNVHRPMTDRQLEDKFRDQAIPVAGEAQTEKLIAACWRIDELEDCGTSFGFSTPAQAVQWTS